MNLLRRVMVAVCAVLAIASAPAVARDDVHPKGWDSVDPPSGESESAAGDFEVVTRGGSVYVMTRRKVKVALFSVLGQPITEATLDNGCYRFRIVSRGIYILRVDSSTFRITI